MLKNVYYLGLFIAIFSLFFFPSLLYAQSTPWSFYNNPLQSNAMDIFYNGLGAANPALRIKSNGDIYMARNVGIGTTTPATLLNISGTGSPAVRLNSTSANNPAYELVSGTATGKVQLAGASYMLIGNSANSPLYFQTNNITNMTIQGDGNVGIGTTAPSTRLSLGQTAADTKLLSIYQDPSGTAGIGTRGAAGLNLYSYNTGYDVAIGQNAGGTFTSNMIVKGNGNVGIGNINPQTLLEVGDAGAANSRGRIRTSTRDGGAGSRSWDFGASVTDFGNYGFNIRDTGMGASAVFIDYGTGNTTIIGKVGVGGLSSTGCDYSGWSHGLCVGSNLRVQNHARIDQSLAINGYAPSACGYALCVGAGAYSQNGFFSPWQTSDIRYKKDIFPLNGSLEKVLQLQAVNFKFKVEQFPNMKFPDNQRFGFIAQDVEKIIPEVVATAEDGYKSIEYGNLTPLLSEAIKEQQKQLEQEKQRNDNLSKDVNNLKHELEILKQQMQSLNDKP